MSKIILIRHTRPDIPEGLCYGHSDVPYERDAFLAWQSQVPWPETYRVYSSPLKRCHDLALKALPGPVCIDHRLKELHFGLWENRLWSELPREDTERWTSDYLNQAPPEGETVQDLTLRLRSFILDLSEGDESHIVFSHAGVIRLLLLAAYGEGLGQYFVRTVDFGSIVILPRRPQAFDFDRLLER
ncbi:MAG: histidine phosphatase family protein [Oligoflexus sp.]|nr:histidine phosphatase family protein [Oligoflexus sp.]